MKKLLTIITILIFGLVLSACGAKYKIRETKSFKYLNKISLPSNEKVNKRIDQKDVDTFNTFAFKSFKEIYKEGDNAFYSPASLYMALSMLAEGANGESLNQINNLLGSSDSRTEINKSLFENNYYENDKGEAKLANSYWINLGLDVKEEYINKLNDKYYATGFASNFDDETKANMAKWINANTNGFLNVKKEEFDDIKDMVLCLINTIYFDNKWATKFDTKDTSTRTFYGKTEESASFMYHDVMHACYIDDEITIAFDKFHNGNSIQYIMANENYTIDNAFSALDRYLNNEIELKSASINLYVPKFKYYTKMNLMEPLMKLGVSDIFDGYKADFSNISDTPLYVSKTIQNTGIEFNESGVKAAAFSFVGMNKSAAEPPEKVTIELNRPFIYLIRDSAGCIIFMGVLNQVNK